MMPYQFKVKPKKDIDLEGEKEKFSPNMGKEMVALDNVLHLFTYWKPLTQTVNAHLTALA